MKKIDTTKKRLLKEAYEMASGLQRSHVMSLADLKVFGDACLLAVRPLSASKIKKIRQHVGVSQAVLAKILNVSHAAIKQWERGERKPSGAALKLLNLVEDKGLSGIL